MLLFYNVARGLFGFFFWFFLGGGVWGGHLFIYLLIIGKGVTVDPIIVSLLKKISISFFFVVSLLSVSD